MGVSLHYYTGPVFKVKVVNYETENTINTCSNESCSKHGITFGGSKFCPECGSPIKPKSFPTTEQSDGLGNIPEDICDLAVCFHKGTPVKIAGQEYHIYMPNYIYLNQEMIEDELSSFNEDSEINYTSITKEKIDSVLSCFLNHENTKKVLNEYFKWIPKENVQVEYSAFSFYW